MATVERLVVWSAVVGTAVALLLLPRSHERATTYASASPRLAAADAVAALALLVACVVGLLLEPSRPGRVALGMATLGWTVQDWTGWSDGPRFAPTIGLVLAPLMVPLLVHVVLVSTGLHERVRTALAALYLIAGTVAVTHALFYDPFLDASCWSACTASNVLLVTAQPDLMHVVATAWLGVTAATALGLAALAIHSTLRASPAALRVRGPAFAAATVLGGVLLTQSVARWRRPRVDPNTSLDSGLYFAVVVATVLVATTWTYGPVLGRWTRRGIAQLVSGLGSAAAAGTVSRVIASVTGDPRVQVVYRLPSSGVYADAAGDPVDPPVVGPGVLPVLRDGQELAVVLHDPRVSSGESIKATIGTALLLALDNERLRSEGLAQLADLRASRARIVETGDAERRRLERNLHDGAQQRMLALSFDLRRAAADARAPGAKEMLASAEAEARAALAELRDLAHGIFPAVLEESGLAPALATFADGAPVPVQVREEVGTRLPPKVERTAYVVVRDAVAVAIDSGSPAVEVTLRVVGGDLVIEVRGAGPGPFLAVEDRVDGSGGHVLVEPDRLRAVIPCAS